MDKNRKCYGFLIMIIDLLFIGLSRLVNTGGVDSGLYGLLAIIVISENVVFFCSRKKKQSKNTNDS